jgi:hypothetical protein
MSIEPGFMVEVYENGKVVHREFFDRAADAQLSRKSLSTTFEGLDIAMSNDAAKIIPLWAGHQAAETSSAS